MFNQQKDQLFALVKTLTKSEKRSFKLYANRFQSDGVTKFILLFDVLDKLAEYDEETVLKKLPGIQKKQLPNLKRHLYKQILIALRLIHISKYIDIQIREQLDFARILYGKGMYMQSLKILDRIKQIAIEHHQDILHLEILEFQKMIESRHITRSRKVKNKMENLLEDSFSRSVITHATSQLSNQNIQIQGFYIQNGHVKSQQECQKVFNHFDRQINEHLTKAERLTFFEKANLFQSYVWLHYICLNFEDAKKQSINWVKLFKEYPAMMVKDPDLYMRGLYYLLTFSFLANDKKNFNTYLSEFEIFIEQGKGEWNDNSQMIAFVYHNLSKLNGCFIENDYLKAEDLVEEIIKQLPTYQSFTDAHRILLFYYKFAYVYFRIGKLDKALDFINQIINQKNAKLREDLFHYTRLLQIICHYELKNYDLMAYIISSLQRSFGKFKDVSLFQKEMLSFLHKLCKLPPNQHTQKFIEFEADLNHIYEDPMQQKSIIYLDLKDWVLQHAYERVS